MLTSNPKLGQAVTQISIEISRLEDQRGVIDNKIEQLELAKKNLSFYVNDDPTSVSIPVNRETVPARADAQTQVTQTPAKKRFSAAARRNMAAAQQKRWSHLRQN